MEITKQEAVQIYNEGSESIKKLLIEKFGKEFLSQDWIKLWEDFCKENNLPVSLPYSDPKTSDEESVNAYVMLTHIVRIVRKNWVPDWNNSSQYKYFPYFDMRTTSGFGFSGSDYVSWSAFSGVGSRLCFPTSEMAEATAKKYLPIYEKFITQ